MSEWNIGDNLHRGIKIALDSGEASSLEEAIKIFESYRLGIEVGPNVADSPTLQSCLLTAVNTGSRCFLGGVQVAGYLDVNLKIPWKNCKTVEQAVLSLNGKPVREVEPYIPRIIVGDVRVPMNTGAFAVRSTFNGWSGGVIPIDEDVQLAEEQEFIPAGILSGAIGVSEAFQFIRGDNALAGRRAIGLSLWRPEGAISWIDNSDPGPEMELLPSKLWIIGLGHLGQAFLWTLGLLPYAQPNEVNIVLHDYDALVPANESTSMLTFSEMTGRKKTRALANWCEARGFRAIINERRFGSNFTIDDDEPQLALCGVDNTLARAALEDVGFKWIIEAGLGKGTEFLTFQMHSFPGPQKAKVKWGDGRSQNADPVQVQQPAYRKLQEEGIDECGLTLIAGKSVGVPFVGAITSSIVISEVLRLIHGQHQYSLIDGSLRCLNNLNAIINNLTVTPVNLGSTPASEETTAAPAGLNLI